MISALLWQKPSPAQCSQLASSSLFLQGSSGFFSSSVVEKNQIASFITKEEINREDFFGVNWLIPELLLPLCQNESSCENMCSYMFICLHFPMELLKLDWRKSDERHVVKYQLEVRKGKTIVQKNSKTQRFEKSFCEKEKVKPNRNKGKYDYREY